MKQDLKWQILLGVTLIGLSAAIYYVHYLIFRDAYHIFMYLIGDIAFVFIEVLLVTLVLHQLLYYREKRAMLNKMNMVIGTFFSEVGMGLLRDFSSFDTKSSVITEKLIVTNDWSDKAFTKIRAGIKSHDFAIDSRRGDLAAMKKFLREKRFFLLGLLENPNLLEHEAFTNLLWAAFHLTEELVSRKSLDGLPDNDHTHLSGDIKRVYQLLIGQWLDYMQHLKASYPYLFSLAVRTNPFDPRASVEVV